MCQQYIKRQKKLFSHDFVNTAYRRKDQDCLTINHDLLLWWTVMDSKSSIIASCYSTCHMPSVNNIKAYKIAHKNAPPPRFILVISSEAESKLASLLINAISQCTLSLLGGHILFFHSDSLLTHAACTLFQARNSTK